MEHEHTIENLVAKYLTWCGRHRSARTLEWYDGHLKSFLAYLGEDRCMSVERLKPWHVVEWVDSHISWGNTYKRGAIVAVQRVLNWAEEMGYIAANPVKKIKKPPAERRNNPMLPEDFDAILARLDMNDPFRDFLEFLWHTGCRPQEARHLELRHYNAERECMVLPKEEAKGKRYPRYIYLHGRSLEIIQKLLALHPEGKLFRNTRGGPWHKYSVCNRMDRLTKATGKRLAAYDTRHGFATRKLVQGVDHLTVATIMGHVDGSMLARVYSHIDKNPEHLRRALADN